MKTTGTTLVKKVLYAIQTGGLTVGMLGVLCIPALSPSAHAQTHSGSFGQGNAMAMAAIAEQEMQEQEKAAARTITASLNDEKENSTDHEAKETEE